MAFANNMNVDLIRILNRAPMATLKTTSRVFLRMFVCIKVLHRYFRFSQLDPFHTFSLVLVHFTVNLKSKMAVFIAIAEEVEFCHFFKSMWRKCQNKGSCMGPLEYSNGLIYYGQLQHFVLR